jgi:HEAT repeat protein
LIVIRSALEGEDGQLAAVALTYAPSLHEAWVSEAVKNAAVHPSVPHRISALDALAKLDPNEAASVCRRVLENPDEHPVVKMAAEEKLPRLDKNGPHEIFRTLLSDPDPSVRILAAGALLELGDRSGLSILEEALGGDDLDLKVDAASEFLDAGVEEDKALEALGEVLGSAAVEPIPRSNAAYALGETRNTDAIPLLIEALKDSDRSVRLAAANSLALLYERMAPLLMEMAVTDPDYMVRLEAIHGLNEVGTEKADRALRRALEDPVPSVRLAAAATLGLHGSTGDQELMEMVREEIEGSDYVTRIAAITALGQVGDRSAATYLEPRLSESSETDPMTRLTSAIAIDRILSRQ